MFVPLTVLATDAEIHRPFPQPIVHFKGFDEGLDFEDAKTRDLRSRCIETLNKVLMSGGSFIWDGDSYRPHSFSSLIPLIFDKIFSAENAKIHAQSDSR